jgi:dTMP kinase
VTGLFITFEGGEGAGKSTQCRLLADALTRDGHRVLRTREPGGSDGAERLRTLLLAGGHGLGPRSEMLLHVAARFDHLEKTILPALARDEIVLCDRFADSTLAYQGYGLTEGDPSVLAFARSLAALLPRQPDLTILVELTRDEARSRLARHGDAPDRYERLDEAFHARVADGFRAIATAEPDRVVAIDGSGGADAVQRAVWAEVSRRLPT